MFREMVGKMITGIGRARPSLISPYLYHPYKANGLLRENEETTYTTAEVFAHHDWTEDSEQEPKDEPEPESNEPVQIPESRRKRRKLTEKVVTPTRKRKSNTPLGPEVQFMEALERVKGEFNRVQTILNQACKLAGGVDEDDLCKALERVIQPRNVRELEDQLTKLEDRNSKLRQELKEKDQGFAMATARVNVTALTLAKVMEDMAHPGRCW